MARAAQARRLKLTRLGWWWLCLLLLLAIAAQVHHANAQTTEDDSSLVSTTDERPAPAGQASTPAPLAQVPTDVPTPAPVAMSSVQADAYEVVRFVNLERTSRGLATLSVDAGLGAAALAYVHLEVQSRCYGHLCPGADPDRLADVLECLYWTARTPDAVVQGWMDSPGHRAVLLHPDMARIGVAYAYGPSPLLAGPDVGGSPLLIDIDQYEYPATFRHWALEVAP